MIDYFKLFKSYHNRLFIYSGIIIIICCFFARLFYSNLQQLNYPSYLLNLCWICIIFIIINVVITCYIISNYKYCMSKPGIAGPKGKIGRKGDMGENRGCDICTLKTKTFVKPKEINKEMNKVNEYNIENIKSKELLSDKDLYTSENKWAKINNINIDQMSVGDSSNICTEEVLRMKIDNKNLEIKNNCIETGKIEAPTYINGVITREIDSKNPSLFSLQYQYGEESKEGNKIKIKNKLLGTKWGIENVVYTDASKNKKGVMKFGDYFKNNNIKYKYNDFTCPKKSAIHRIDTIYKPGDIKLKKSGKIEGIKVYCKDTNNGDLVKIKNEKTGILEDGAVFGKQPIPSNKTGNSVIKEVSCNPIRYKGRKVPTFLSGVGAKHGIGVNALKFYNCSYKK